jgi:hypothetical protein
MSIENFYDIMGLRNFMLKELSLQGKIYIVCQVIYFFLITKGLFVLIEVKNEIKKRNEILSSKDVSGE